VTIEIAILVLSGAFLHAGWNALVKTASDRLLVISAVAFAQTLTGALMIPFVSAPYMASWPAIGLSTLFHYLYYTFLFQAYRFGDLSQVYPLLAGSHQCWLQLVLQYLGMRYCRCQLILEWQLLLWV